MTSGEATHGQNPEKHQQRWAEAEKPIQVNEKEGPESREQTRKGQWNKLAHFSSFSLLSTSLCHHLAWTTAPVLLEPLLQSPNGSHVPSATFHSLSLRSHSNVSKWKTSHITVLLTTLQWLRTKSLTRHSVHICWISQRKWVVQGMVSNADKQVKENKCTGWVWESYDLGRAVSQWGGGVEWGMSRGDYL